MTDYDQQFYWEVLALTTRRRAARRCKLLHHLWADDASTGKPRGSLTCGLPAFPDACSPHAAAAMHSSSTAVEDKQRQHQAAPTQQDALICKSTTTSVPCMQRHCGAGERPTSVLAISAHRRPERLTVCTFAGLVKPRLPSVGVMASPAAMVGRVACRSSIL